MMDLLNLCLLVCLFVCLFFVCLLGFLFVCLFFVCLLVCLFVFMLVSLFCDYLPTAGHSLWALAGAGR